MVGCPQIAWLCFEFYILRLVDNSFYLRCLGDNGLPEAMDGVALDSNEETTSLQPPVGTPSSTAVAATSESMDDVEEATNTTEGRYRC